jgi:NAD(P)H dehydrogenase (quinone)
MFAVTGASGRLGRLVVRMLLQHVDAASVLALSRRPGAGRELGVASRLADFDDPDTLRYAFDGVERLMIISTNNILDPTGRRIRQHDNAVRAAARAGVGHVVYSSLSRADDPAHPAVVAADHRATETTLAECGLPHTILGNSMYTELLLMGLDATLAGGLLLDNCGSGASAYVSRADCAAVAAAVLAGGVHVGQRLDVTGPQALTQWEIAALITEFSGVPVRYVPITDEETVAGLMAHGMQETTAQQFATMGRSIREGYTSTVTDVVERTTGRRATSIADFLAAAFEVSSRGGHRLGYTGRGCALTRSRPRLGGYPRTRRTGRRPPW